MEKFGEIIKSEVTKRVVRLVLEWGMPIITAVWAWLVKLPGPVVVLIFLAAIIIVPAAVKRIAEGILWIKNRFGKRTQYQTRTEMIISGSSLEREVGNSNTVWACFATGHHFNGLPEDMKRKFKRVILADPHSEIFPVLTEKATTPTSVVDIETATEFLGKAVVRWSREPISTLVIFDPEDLNGRALFQPYLPHIEPSNWIVLKPNRKEDEKNYKTLKRCFEEIWALASVPDTTDGKINP
ncbi:MAG: hypothetical protein M1609_03315 [Firmicutes bacterium]|nr:hypothetical protein [Bacillota bacterium]